MTIATNLKQLPAKLLSSLLVLMLAGSAFGQGVTTSALNGNVTGNTGEVLIGATVIAVHVPTGTVYGTTTRYDGNYNITNMKPGGPYSVKVTYIGFKTEEKSGINLQLSQNLKLNFVLSAQDITTEEVVVTGEKNPLLSASRTGAATNVSSDQLKALPTVSRSIQDYTRLTPQINGNSAAGKNNRYNNIQVDGAVLNDVFGLASNGTPGGQAGTQPISLDAIQEFNVSIAPFDVRLGGFTGASINAITRSGTNKFSGSAYTFYRNQNFVGDGVNEVPFADFTEKSYGFRLGGPIINDQLFFFINGEIGRKETPSSISVGTTASPTTFVVTDDFYTFLNTLKSDYGYNAGSYSAFNRGTDSDKLFVRFDYNMDEANTFTLRHNYVNASDDNLVRTTTDFHLGNRNYAFTSMQNSTVFQWNSILSTDMSNEFRVSYTAIRDQRDPDGSKFPSVRIKTGSTNVYVGTENFSTKNALDQDLIEVTDNFTYYLDEHTITLGTNNEFFTFSNLFIRNYYGLYEFDSYADFYAKKPSRYEYSYGLKKDLNGANVYSAGYEPRAEFDAARWGFYAQDEWDVLPELRLTFGLRADITNFGSEPSRNDSVPVYFKYKTTEVATGSLQLSPRFGFNYDVFNDDQLQVRGGTGIFSGRTPYVWVSNNFGNTGVDIGRVQVTGSTANALGFSSDPNNQPYPGKPGVTLSPVKTSEINLMDKDFVFPQVWRTNIAFDYQLPEGFIATIEGIYSMNWNDAFYQDINVQKSNTTLADGGKLADGRQHHWTKVDYKTAGKVNSSNFTNVMLLKNTSEGYQMNLTPMIQKPLNAGEDFMKNIGLTVAYTYSKSEDVNSVTSSQAVSQVRFNPTKDVFNPALSTSDYEIKHRFMSSVTYALNWADFLGDDLQGFNSTFSFFIESRSGLPYSYTYNGDMNGDGFDSNDLMFVPRNKDEIALVTVSSSGAVTGDAPQETYDALFALINSDDYLKENKGKILPRNGGNLPWITTVDFRFAQEIPLLVPGLEDNKFEFTLDILNVANLLNKDWGVSDQLVNNRFLRYRGKQADNATVHAGKQVFSFDSPYTSPYMKNDSQSRYYIQIGARYTF
ncbi:MAG: carboxypeptidase regulatory-like domain-containing protein [Bacteroidetes bacterium]|nr:carboxypeptidase regulatory-like domain-containing protein [Bacteroidota bacterium]